MENNEKNKNIYKSGRNNDTVYGPLLIKRLKIDRSFRKADNKNIKRNNRGDGPDN